MADKDPKKAINDTSKAVDNLKDELAAIYDAVTSIVDKLVEGFEEAAEEIAGATSAAETMSKTFQRGLVADLKNAVKNAKDLAGMEAQASKGALKRSEIERKRKHIEEEKAKLLMQQKVMAERYGMQQDENLDAAVQEYEAQLKSLDAIQALNDEMILQGGLTDAILKNIKDYVTELDKSGIAAALLNDEVSGMSKLMVAGEAAIIALAKGAMEASNNINAVQKATGVSYSSALKLQASFAVIAINTSKAYVNSVELNKSFAALTESTGLLLDYSGDTLVTMTGLTKQMGLSAEAGAQLSLLASMQSSDTESVLDNVDATVNAVNKQNKTAISLKQIYGDISSASKAIVVSLGMSPELLAEAATQARALGTDLAGVDAIASSLLDFEQSIEAELSAELLTGKQINLEKARQLALDNDLAGLAEEIKDNTALTESFASGNRIQQQALADALGMSRDELAGMVYQQELMSMGQDRFIEKYGEQAHQQLMAQSAQEKFADTMTKIQTIIADMALTFAPILDMVALIAEHTWVAYTAMTLIAGLSLAKTIMSMATMSATLATSAVSGITLASALTIGIGTVAILAAIAGIVAAMNSAADDAQRVQDGIADASRGPFSITDAYGATAITAKGDSLAVSPNVTKGRDDSRMVALLEKIANKDSNVYMDSQKVGTAMAMGYSKA
jgi:AraC-like DNA-binding protein